MSAMPRPIEDFEVEPRVFQDPIERIARLLKVLIALQVLNIAVTLLLCVR